MEFHGEVGILKQVSGEHQHYGFIGLHKSLPQQFLKAGESDGGSGFTANSLGADLSLSLRDLELADLVTSTAVA